jgi:SAM-dependent methyltransferase
MNLDRTPAASGSDPLPFSPAAERNQGAILDVLTRLLPAQAAVLEIASGTGQHAAHFATAQPLWQWQPTDGDPQSLPAIAARCAARTNVRSPLMLDVLATPWPQPPGRFDLPAFDALYCANMLHISPWATCVALLLGAARHLRVGGLLVLYGPFVVDGVATAPGNLAFDADLRARNPQWGLRRLADVVDQAQACGLVFEQCFEMPANNMTVTLRRQGATG